ncbi:MAG: hypothetical protein RR712_00605 [Terrisporobacter sp.]|uniref:hypothetical protein n=1 Tax=Terrisporobacter sp. TaxID=1965305 RepID=UPI002FCB5053
MCEIIDFYQFKYSRCNYYINVFISKESAEGLKGLINERLKDKRLSREYGCAYITLKEKIVKSDNNLDLVMLRLNKCYLQYLKDLYYDYYGREECLCVKEVIQHIQYFLEEDTDNINKFYNLKENTKINILSSI